MQGSKLYVGNLNYSVTNQQLEQLFANHGTIKSVNVIEGKGFGFVEMSSPAEAEKSKDALNNSDFNGRPLKIDEAKPQQPRRDFNDNRRRY
jgi:RNA recognition motif-containing protein